MLKDILLVALTGLFTLVASFGSQYVLGKTQMRRDNRQLLLEHSANVLAAAHNIARIFRIWARATQPEANVSLWAIYAALDDREDASCSDLLNQRTLLASSVSVLEVLSRDQKLVNAALSLLELQNDLSFPALESVLCEVGTSEEVETFRELCLSRADDFDDASKEFLNRCRSKIAV